MTNQNETKEARRLSDEEIICAWMEPKPTKGPFDMRPWRSMSQNGWWVATGRMDAPNEWHPRRCTLDALWEIETRLAEKGWHVRDAYIADLWRVTLAPDPARYDWRLLHATPAQKIRALAFILRPIVESR